MRLSVISIGNSKGIRIPKAILDRYKIDNSVEVELQEHSLLIKPTRKPRQGWEEAFKQMHENGDDKLLIPDMFDDETWEV